MTRALGIAIEASEVLGIIVHRRRVEARGRVAFRSADEIGAALDELVGTLRPARRTAVSVVVCAAWARTKRLDGIPKVPRKLANALVRENAASFFVSPSPVELTDVAFDAAGAAFAAAFDKQLLESVVRTLREQELRIRRIAPATATLERLGLLAIRNPADALESLGEEATAYQDVFAATDSRIPAPLEWRPRLAEQSARRIRTIRRSALATALLATALFAAIGPGVRAGQQTRNNEAALSLVEHDWRTATSVEAQLRRTTQKLEALESFRAHRGEVTRLLGNLSSALPESTALVVLHVDSVSGGFTALSPDIGDALPSITGLDDIVAPKIAGSITRELVNGVHVERAAFQFRRRASRGKIGQRRTNTRAQGDST